MVKKLEKSRHNRLRGWIINLSIFLIVLLVFFIIDGTAWKPNLNDSNNLAGRTIDFLLGSKLFNEWISPFSFPVFNLAITLFVVGLFVKAVKDIFSIKKSKERYE